MTFDLRLAYSPDKVYTGEAKVMQDLMKIRRNASVVVTNALVKGTGHVDDLIDISNGSENPPYASTISLSNQLVVPATSANPDRLVTPANYPGVTLNPTPANTGCDPAIFAWTGYQF